MEVRAALDSDEAALARLRWRWGSEGPDPVPSLEDFMPEGPGHLNRLCGDLQSVYVVPELRSEGIGAALVDAVLRRAEHLGLEHVTVSSGRRAVSLYQRAGFAVSPKLLRFPPSEG